MRTKLQKWVFPSVLLKMLVGILLWMGISAPAFATTPPLFWANKIGDFGNDDAVMVTDRDGNIFYLGYFVGERTIGGVTLSSPNGYDFFLAKFSRLGAPFWVRQWGSTGHETTKRMVVDANGDLVVIGQFTGSANFGGSTYTSRGFDDVFIAKYSGINGDHQWSTPLGASSARLLAIDLAMDPATNDIVFTVSFSETVDFSGSNAPNATLVGEGLGDIALVRYGNGGAFRWAKKFASVGGDYPQNVAIDASGRIYLTGTFEGLSIDLSQGTGAPLPGPGRFLAVFSSSGISLRSKKITGDPVSQLGRKRLQVDTAGNTFLIAGPSLLKLSSADGSQIWSVPDPGLKEFAVTGGGELWGIGSFSGSLTLGSDTYTSAGYTDAFVAQFAAANGAVLSSRVIGGNREETGQSISISPAGYVMLQGDFQGNASLGLNVFGQTVTLSTTQWTEGFIVELGNGGAAPTCTYGLSSSSLSAGPASGTGSVTVNTAAGCNWSAMSNTAWISITSAAQGFGNGGIDFAFDENTGRRARSGTMTIAGQSFTLQQGPDTSPVRGSLLRAFDLASGTRSEDHIATDPQGNLIYCGFFLGTINILGTPVTATDSYDFYVAKVTPAGGLLWIRTWGGEGFQTPTALAVDTAGDIVVVGNFTGTVNFGTTVRAIGDYYDMFLVKFSGLNGNPLWSKAFGANPGLIGVADVATDANGAVVFTAQFSGTIDFSRVGTPSATLTGGGGNDVVLARYGADGQYQWAKSFGTPNIESSQNVAIGGNGTIFIDGGFFDLLDLSQGTGTALTGGGRFLAAFAANGNSLWSKKITADQFIFGVRKRLLADAAGNVSFLSTTSLTKVSGSNGASLWTAPVPGFTEMALDAQGGIWLAGSFSGTVNAGDGNLVSKGYNDVLVAKYNSSTGQLFWARRMGGIGDDDSFGVAASPTGYVGILGTFQRTADFGADVDDNAVVLTTNDWSNGFLAIFSTLVTPPRVPGSPQHFHLQ